MEKLNLLLLDDSKEDTDLIRLTLERAGLNFELTLTNDEKGFTTTLKNHHYDLIMTDNALPQFCASGALEIIKSLKIKTPCIVITGTTSDELAVELMKKGACDYVLKDRLVRLPTSIINAVKNSRLEITNKQKLAEIIKHKELMKEAEALAHFGSWENDHVDNTSYWSDETYRIVGYEPGEISPSADHLMTKIHPDDLEHVKKTIDNAKEHLHHIKYSYRIIPQPGATPKYISAQMFITRNDKEKIIRTHGLIQDVTERKIAEKKTTSAEKKYRNLFENNPVPTWVIDEKTSKFKAVNYAAINHYGYSHAEFMSMTALDIRTDEEKARYLLLDLVKGPFGNIGIWEHKKKDGTIIHVEIILDTIIYENEKSILVIANDITERAQAENKLKHTTQRLKQAQEIAHIGSWEHNLVQNKLIWSDEMYRIYGLSVNDDIQSFQKFITFIHPEDLQYVLDQINNSLNTLTACSYHHRIVRTNGDVRHMHAQFEYELDNGGNPVTRYGVVQDVTEVIEAENKLKHTTEHLKQAQAIAHIGSWELDLQTGVALWSDEACRIFGLPPEENKQSFESFVSFIHPDDLEVSLKEIRESNENLRPAVFTHRVIRKDGAVRYMYTRGEFEFNSDGKPIGIHGISHDVTDIRESEEALKQSEANLRLILDTLPLAISTRNYQGKVLYANKKFAELHGFTPEQMIGGMINKMTPIANEVKGYISRDQEVITTGETKVVPEIAFVTWNGETRFFHLTKLPYTPTGSAEKAVLGISQDITEIKEAQQALVQSEANLRLIMDLLPQTIAVRNFAGEFLFANKGFASMYGVNPEDLIGSTIRKMIPAGNSPEEFLQRDQRVITSNEITVMPEATITDYKGEIKTYTITKVPFTPAGQKEPAVLGIGHDITERKKAEVDRRKMTADIVQRNIDLEQFSYIVSHNLRAPIANLLGISDLIDNGDLSTDEKIFLLKGFSESVKKLDNVIIDLNQVTQAKHAINENKEPVIFSALVNNIKNNIDNLLSNPDISIKTNFGEVDSFYTVVNYMHSIFYNMITNCIKYKQPNTPLVCEIKSKKLPGFIRLTFKDNGKGMDLKKSGDDIFELYKRFHIGATAGKGMGLFMVKTHVESLGGTINVISEIDKGTEFTIELPLTQDA